MQSLAWSTVLLLVLLVPGFAFGLGFTAPAGYGRDATPRNPLAALTATVIAAVVVHAILSAVLDGMAGLSKTSSVRVDWSQIIEAVQMPSPRPDATPDPRDGDTAAERAGLEAEAFPWRIAGYVLASAITGFFLGFCAGIPVARGRISFLQEHAWASRIRTEESKRATINYAHVLADVADSGQQLLYRGRVMYFSLRGEGSFAYVVLAATEQRLLNLTGNAPRPGPRRPIGGRALSQRRSAASNAASWIPFWPFSQQTRPVEDPGAIMVISGNNIKDVVFQGSYRIEGFDEAADLVAEMEAALRAGNEARAAEIRKKLGAAPIAQPISPQRRTMFGPVREAQWLLSAAGLYDGPIDGRAGPLTREALRLYQHSRGLDADGLVGANTLARLRLEYGD